MFFEAQRAIGLRSSPLECLDGLDGVVINEKADAVEAASAIVGAEIEMANKYKIYAPGGWDDIFYALEKTSFFNRNIQRCFGSCTGWHVDLMYSQGLGKEQSWHVNRPNSLTCCCINRPEATLYDDNDVVLGVVQEPFLCCCDMKFTVFDEFEEPVLYVKSSTCQAGYLCPLPCPCLDCNDVEFDIVDAGTGDKVGDMKKKVPSWFTWVVAPDVDDYHVQWPGVKDPKHKALLMVAALYIDFRHFNQNANGGPTRKLGAGLLGQQLISG